MHHQAQQPPSSTLTYCTVPALVACRSQLLLTAAAAVRSNGMKLLLDCGSVPYFCFACIVPQATLLYWAGNSVFFYGMQSALSVPSVARKLGLPNMLLPMPRGPREERGGLRAAEAAAAGVLC
jgi:hypothetical protein